MNSPGSYKSILKLQSHHSSDTVVASFTCVLVLHCPIIVLSVSSRGHSECMRAAAVLVFLVSFCLNKLEYLCLCVHDLFAYCFYEGFHSYFMFTPWNWISSRFQLNQIGNRGVDRHDWHGSPATNQDRLPLSAYLAAMGHVPRLFTLSSHVSHKKRQWHVNERCIRAYCIHIQHRDRAGSQGELTVAMLQSRTQ